MNDLLFGFARYLAENNIFNKFQEGGQHFLPKNVVIPRKKVKQVRFFGPIRKKLIVYFGQV
jgi:propanediol utilization protein